jgi:DNA-binding LytR/AlgR family response regulator
MRALVVDDEAPARRRLGRMLGELGCEVIAEAGDAAEGLTQARLHAPDVMFLDVRMPGMDGITFAQRHVDLPPVVFCTAHDEHAVEAFEVNAVDYLLKPVRKERLAAALEKVRKATTASQAQVRKALDAVAPTSATRVVASTRGAVHFFDALTLTRFWSSDKYTVFRADGEERLIEESLNELEARLAAHGFLRVHRAELVRLSAIRSFGVMDGVHEVTLSDGQRARISRRSVTAIKAALGL